MQIFLFLLLFGVRVKKSDLSLVTKYFSIYNAIRIKNKTDEEVVNGWVGGNGHKRIRTKDFQFCILSTYLFLSTFLLLILPIRYLREMTMFYICCKVNKQEKFTI